MEPVSTILITASLATAANLREKLAQLGALLWTSGNVLATRLPREELLESVPESRDRDDVRLFDRDLPQEVLKELPAAARLLVETQRNPPAKQESAERGLSWDAAGHEAPRYLGGVGKPSP